MSLASKRNLDNKTIEAQDEFLNEMENKINKDMSKQNKYLKEMFLVTKGANGPSILKNFSEFIKLNKDDDKFVKENVKKFTEVEKVLSALITIQNQQQIENEREENQKKQILAKTLEQVLELFEKLDEEKEPGKEKQQEKEVDGLLNNIKGNVKDTIIDIHLMELDKELEKDPNSKDEKFKEVAEQKKKEMKIGLNKSLNKELDIDEPEEDKKDNKGQKTVGGKVKEMGTEMMEDMAKATENPLEMINGGGLFAIISIIKKAFDEVEKMQNENGKRSRDLNQ